MWCRKMHEYFLLNSDYGGMAWTCNPVHIEIEQILNSCCDMTFTHTAQNCIVLVFMKILGSNLLINFLVFQKLYGPTTKMCRLTTKIK